MTGSRSAAAAAALVAVFASIALANVLFYPPGLGYDANAHREYTESLRQGELLQEEGAYYHPPGFYALAAGVTWLGEQAGLGQPLRLTQLVNALLASATALFVLVLGRTVFPGRPVVHLAALGLFTAGALVLKSAAMFHPETLSLFLSTLALVVAARMLSVRPYPLAWAALLGVVLAAGQLVRAFALWTFAVVLLTLAAVALTRSAMRRRILAVGGIVVAATALVAGPWYVYQEARYGDPVFSRPQEPTPLWERRPLAFYVDPGLPELVTHPYRPYFTNRFAPQLYADAWGDWYGVFGWNAAHGPPDEATRRELVAQNIVGIIPTLLAVAGWLALLAVSLVRLGHAPERLLVALLPLAGIAGMLYFTVSYPTPDGDVIKASYMLTTAPAWALCFGLAVERLFVWRRALGIGLAVALVLGALVSLRFSLYPSLLGGVL